MSDYVLIDDPRNAPDATFSAEEARARLRTLLDLEARVEAHISAAEALGAVVESYTLPFWREAATLRSRLVYGPWPQLKRPRNWMHYQQISDRIDENLRSSAAYLGAAIRRDLGATR